jgi:hypothetical protein
MMKASDLFNVLDDPELDADDKLEAVRRMISNRRSCTPAENEAILKELVQCNS